MQHDDTAFMEVMEAFFGEEALMKTMIILMNNMAEYDSDSLCQVPIMLLSEDVRINIIESGFIPFTSRTVMIPFSRMNRKQLQALGKAFDHADHTNTIMMDSMLRQGVHTYLSPHCFRVDAVQVLYNVHQIVCGGMRESVTKGAKHAEWSHVASIVKTRIIDSVVLPTEVLKLAQEKIATASIP